MQNLLIGIVLVAISIWFVSALPRLMQLTTLPANIASTLTIPNPVGSPAPVPADVPGASDGEVPPGSGETPRNAPLPATGILSGRLSCAGCTGGVEIYSARGSRLVLSVDAQGRFRTDLPPGDYVIQLPGGYGAQGFHIVAGRTTTLNLAR